MSDFADILAISNAYLWTAFVLLARIGAMLAVLPVFGEQTIPLRIRLSATIAFCVVIFPTSMASPPPLPISLMSAVAFVLPEVVAGLFFGLLLRFFIMTLQIAGSIAAQSTSLSQIFGGSAGTDPQPAIGHMLVIAGLALATLMGLHVHFAKFMIHSYELVPMGILISDEIVADLGMKSVSRTFELGFILAAPFMIGSLIYNITLGIINKAMPQLMVSFVGAPAITAGGLFLLMITAPIILSIWISEFTTFIRAGEGL